MSAVYSSIVSAGEGLDLGHVGTRVINTLRMEKGFRGSVDSDVNKYVFKSQNYCTIAITQCSITQKKYVLESISKGGVMR